MKRVLCCLLTGVLLVSGCTDSAEVSNIAANIGLLQSNVSNIEQLIEEAQRQREWDTTNVVTSEMLLFKKLELETLREQRHRRELIINQLAHCDAMIAAWGDNIESLRAQMKENDRLRKDASVGQHPGEAASVPFVVRPLSSHFDEFYQYRLAGATREAYSILDIPDNSDHTERRAAAKQAAERFLSRLRFAGQQAERRAAECKRELGIVDVLGVDSEIRMVLRLDDAGSVSPAFMLGSVDIETWDLESLLLGTVGPDWFSIYHMEFREGTRLLRDKWKVGN
jgi:hypothetical protein